MTADRRPGQPALTAATMLQRATANISIASSVVLVFDAGLVPVRRAPRSKRDPQPFRAVGRAAPGVDIVAAQGPGAPTAAITVEFLAALGVQDVICVGTAGALTPQPGIGLDGSVGVVASAQSDEGTSQHYGGHRDPDPKLTSLLLERHPDTSVVALTTDVPFRHTPDRLASHRERADVIEMEVAAVFAAAKFFAMRAAALVICSDVFGQGPHWDMLDAHDVAGGLRNGVNTAVNTLAGFQAINQSSARTSRTR